MTVKTVLYIKADTNDADYITSEDKISDDDLEVVRKVCNVIKEHGPKYDYNWTTGNIGDPYKQWGHILTELEIEIFNHYIPYGEYGIHTIEEVELRRIEVLEKFI